MSSRERDDDLDDLKHAIAVVGYACRFPGAPDSDTFWRNLRNGVESVSTFTEEEAAAEGARLEDLRHPRYVRSAALLEDVFSFDAELFGFTPREARLLDPQHRIFFECGWAALEHAGYDPRQFRGPIGVFAGSFLNGYLLHHLMSNPEVMESAGWLTARILNDKDFLTTRLSYLLNLRGPSVSVQTACSTSLVATHLACQSLLSFDCDMALAGGVAIQIPQHLGYRHEEGGIFSPDGRCRPFDAKAQGTVGGSGAGLVVLRRLEDALEDGDLIHAVIRGSAINNDGALKAGYTAPSIEAQAEVIAAAQSLAGVDPETITYIEAHGTATALGDPIEIEALAQVFNARTAKRGFCAVGSVKSNFGHLDAAAGVAGLIKTVLALEHGEIPPSLHCSEPNPRIRFPETPFRVNAELADWPAGPVPRRAGVSSFGVGGTNAHVVLEEAPPRAASGPGRPWQLLPLSAATGAALERVSGLLAGHLDARPNLELADVAYTLSVGRRALPSRRFVVADSPESARRSLALRDDDAPPLPPAGERVPVAFLFPGQGAQQAGMGAELYRSEPAFREEVDRCADLLKAHVRFDLRSLLLGGEAAGASLRETEVSQPAIFVVSYALARLWAEWGIEPRALLGHSLGEYVAACLAGVFELPEALALVAARGRLMQSLPAGAMLSVALPADRAAELATGELSLAAANAADLSVIAGSEAAIDRLERRLRASQVETRRLDTTRAFHSPLVEPILDAFAAEVAKIQLREPRIPFVSNLTSDWIRPGEATDPSYWVRQMRQPVRFAESLDTLRESREDLLLLEVGPGRALSSLARRRGAAAFASLASKGESGSEQASLLTVLGELWQRGVEVDWPGLYRYQKRRREVLPVYPFERVRHWVPARIRAASGDTAPPPVEDDIAAPAAEAGPGPAAPANELEARLAALWREMLGLDRVGRHDDFFALGGHSLLATQLVSRVRDAFGVELSLESFFAHPTLAKLAARLAEEAPAEAAAPAVRAIPRRSDRDDRPLSFAQMRFWFLDRLAPGGSALNIPMAVRLRGPLDFAALKAALARGVARHETLRTAFGSRDGQPVQTLLPGLTVEPLWVELAGEAELEQLMAREAAEPFDLERPPLLRATVARLGPGHSVLLLTVHHIVSDGWSMLVLVRELAALYAEETGGAPAALPELPVDYADYAVWQREWLGTEAARAQLEYWRERLAGELPVLELPVDRPRRRDSGHRGGRLTSTLPAALGRELRGLGQAQGATLFMTLLAGFKLLVHRLSGQEDLIVGSPIAGRRSRELEGLIGVFLNTLALRTDLSGVPSFRQLLTRVTETTLGAFAHQDLPFEKLVEELRPDRDLGRTPLFQVFFNMLNYPLGEVSVAGLRFETFAPPEVGTKFDLTLYAFEEGGAVRLDWLYDAELFDGPRIEEMARQYRSLLEQATADPERALDRFSLLTEEALAVLPDPRQALEVRDFPTVVDELRLRVAETPEAVALSWGETEQTYAALWASAEREALRLLATGLKPGGRVAVSGQRSPDLFAAWIGVLAAGGVLVPLDRELPAPRLTRMLEIAGVGLLIEAGPEGSDLAWAGELPGLRVLRPGDLSGEPAGDLPLPVVGSGDDAYVFFTSGSSGTPKAVLGNHRGLSHFLSWEREAFAITPGLRTAQLIALTFDAVLRDVFLPLTSGATLCVPPGPAQLGAPEVWEWLARERVHLFHTVPSLAESWLAEVPPGLSLPEIRWVLLAGEPLSADLVGRWRSRFPAAGVANLYGPTETTLVKTCFRVPEDPAPGVQPLGFPLPGAQLLLVSPGGELCGVGEPGEILVRTPYRTSGYLAAPEEDRARFAPNPWTGEAGDVVYRTGDRGRYRLDGTVEYLGRLDRQIKIRGVRIEPEEVRCGLLAQPGVRNAAVRAWKDEGGRPYLVAYVEAAEGAVPTARELRAALSRELPAAMVPSSFVFLDALPRTRSGKIDLGSLPEPREERPKAELRAPRTPLEELLAGIWADLLGRERVGLDDDFFELGGHSLLAARLLARIETLCGVRLPVRRIFERPTLAALAGEVEAARGAADLPPLARQEGAAGRPLSFSQQRLWFLEQLAPGRSAYHIPAAWRIRGPLDAARLERALTSVVARHEALRTRFAAPDGRAVQIAGPAEPVALPRLDLSPLGSGAEAEAGRALTEAVERPFDLSRPPLLRALLVRLEDEDYRLGIVLHHIAADAWSVGILMHEVAAFYQEREVELPVLAVQYADFAAWQRGWLTDERLAGEIGFWREQLAGVPDLLALPTDRPRPVLQSLEGDQLPIALPLPLAAAVESLGRREGATLYMVLLSVFEALLSRYSGQRDFTVGTPVANRGRAEVEPLIGFFVNTLVLRADLNGEPTLRQLVRRVRETTFAAFEHQALPFEKLVDELEIRRDLSRSPLFQVMFALHNTPLPRLELPGLAFEPVPLAGSTSKFDLTLHLRATEEGLAGFLEYSTRLFDEATIRRFADCFARLLAGALAEPDRSLELLPLLSDAERLQLVADWNDTAWAVGEKCVHQRIAAKAAERPEAIALVAGDETLTYGELDSRANRLAHRLRRRGLKPEGLVALLLERTPDLLVSLLAVMKAGGSYLPLDPSYPAARLALMLEDGAAPLLLTHAACADRIPETTAEVLLLEEEPVGPGPAAPPPEWAHAGSRCYVLYTSGSTGRPKGVEICHGAVINLLESMAEMLGLTEADRVLAITSLSFDISVLELYLPLLSGARVELAPRETATDPLSIRDRIEQGGITVAQATPSTWRMLADADLREARHLTALSGGEALAPDLAARLTSVVGSLWNGYGPTETTVYSTFARIGPGERITLGRPLRNTALYVLDAHLEPTPLGIPGEVCLAGAGLARGYLGRPELTADRFRPDPWAGVPGARLYRVGDLGRFLPDGRLLFEGRLDHQVKIRGVRLELGEIEAALTAHPAVREAVVAALDLGTGAPQLVAYVEPVAEAGLAVEPLRAFLAERLPVSAHPSRYVLLEALPRTPNGKVDRKALPRPDLERPSGDRPFVAPRTPVEETLARIWQEVLALPEAGVEDDFFALGGDSILGVQVVFKAREKGLILTTAQIFQHPTIAGLASVAEPAPPEPAAAPQAEDDFGWSESDLEEILKKI
ncbi:MAG TPA: amino acid adenylation domain-containing protein [Thermoanaerobaculia bacterium]|nr:amino acid adenylation domain-containing protein [Thermoanaerobaculia bacterium]